MEYGNHLFAITHPKAITGIVILSGLLWYVLRKRDSDRIIVFSIAWFLITLLPQSNLYPINAYMAEHWLYLPSVGFFLVVAVGMWLFVLRLLAESRDRLGRVFSTSSDSGFSRKRDLLDSKHDTDEFRTIAQSSSKSETA